MEDLPAKGIKRQALRVCKRQALVWNSFNRAAWKEGVSNIGQPYGPVKIEGAGHG